MHKILKKWIELQGKLDKCTIILRDFITPSIIERIGRQTISKGI